MGFFSDMNEDFNDDEKEMKPITPSKEVKEEEKEGDEDIFIPDEITDDDDFSMNEDKQLDADMREILGEDEDEPSDDIVEEKEEDAPKKDLEETSEESRKKVASVLEKIKHEEPVEVKEVQKPSVSNGTVISKGTVVDGNVTTEEAVVVSGEITGALKAQDIFVESSGKVMNGIEGKSVTISGQVKGNVHGEKISIENSKISGGLVGEKSVVVKEKAVVVGNISSDSLVVYGKIKGDLSCKGVVDLKTGSVVKGNITALEVLIDKGAHFQGSIIKTGEIDDSLFE